MFSSEQPALELHLTILPIVGTATTAALVALWAATSTRHWLWRAFALWAAAAALIPIRGYEPAIVFAISGPLTSVIFHNARWIASRSLAADQPAVRTGKNLRFGLRDVFLAMLMLGLTLTLLIHVLKQVPKLDWFEMILPATAISAVTILSSLVTRGSRRWLAAVALVAVIAVECWLLYPEVKWLYRWDTLGFGFFLFAKLQAAENYRHGLAITAIALSELAGAIILAYYAFNGQAITVQARVIRPLAQFAAFVALFGLALTYVQMLCFTHLPPTPLSPQNRFSDVVRIAERAQVLNPSSLSIADLRANVAQASAADELEILYRELPPILENTNAISISIDQCTDEFFSGPCMNRTQAFRLLARSLSAEAKAATANNDFGRAADFARESLRLGAILSRGGLVVDMLVGSALTSVGNHDLAVIRQRLDRAETLAGLSDLQRVEKELEPLNIVFDRDVAFCQRAFGWSVRFEQIVNQWLYGSPRNWSSFRATPKAQARTLAFNHLLQADLALRLFQKEQGRFPNSLDELVPRYLPEVLRDPFIDRPLIYRPVNGQFTLYSVGQDGHDDGGKFSSDPSRDGYDLDLDTLTRP